MKRGSIMTEYVQQRYMNDCGVACLAMLLDIPYTNLRAYVLAHFQRRGLRSIPGLSANDEMILAAKLGTRLRFIYVDDDNRQDAINVLSGRKAILGVPGRNCDNPDYMHSVYWDGERLYDPSPSGKYQANGLTAFRDMFCAEIALEE